MSSNIFSLNTVSIMIIFLTILIIVNMALVVFCIFINKKCIDKYNRIWNKFDNKNLEDDIQKLIKDMENSNHECQSSKLFCSEINGKMTKCIQKIGFIKYDAYKSGNNGLSFALALLDNEDNGVLLNSVYNRNYSNIYAKEIVKGEAKGVLSKEEKDTLSKAINDKSFM